MSTQAIPPLVGLVADPQLRIEPNTLTQVAAALQKQVTRDFAPVWGTPATVAAFPGGHVPEGYWQIVVLPSLDDPGALGYHDDFHHQPYSLVQFDGDWPKTCSHELLEMLADPWGRRLVVCTRMGSRIRTLVEVCDPCEAFGYHVDGFELSDFVLPDYYGPHRWRHVPHAHWPSLSYCRAVTHPLEVAQGGYLSWVDQNGTWWQEVWFGTSPQLRELGRLEGEGSLRSRVDAVTRRSRG